MTDKYDKNGLIYVCHPWGDTEESTRKNTENVIPYLKLLEKLGFIPIYTPFINDKMGLTREQCLEMDFKIIDHMEKIVFCGEKLSDGCIRELEFSIKSGVFVYFLMINDEKYTFYRSALEEDDVLEGII